MPTEAACAVARKQPRQYQLNSYEKAANKNIIVNLDTGLGKTLVACLLIKKELQNLSPIRRLQKLIIFLAPQVPTLTPSLHFLFD